MQNVNVHWPEKKRGCIVSWIEAERRNRGPSGPSRALRMCALAYSSDGAQARWSKSWRQTSSPRPSGDVAALSPLDSGALPSFSVTIRPWRARKPPEAARSMRWETEAAAGALLATARLQPVERRSMRLFLASESGPLYALDGRRYLDLRLTRSSIESEADDR
ncbi:hypothetical protein AXG93_4461s1450 [Marchantia polymorpha subsp. ruderalis]|uniref:Uncharacterized protein n=1 Tax=Marchantia polymorpha subsp. ruderalis TaxID=1480154 RepID=A0A176WQR3_MARPO|nr:hypothetical protein AXG93_4461s1450 [Marchantia polymorpha subsp. ruderalis]